ncbi:hypothetical protein [Candidatus Finniella inopinata]|uniref:hypothetical protein n=1 Tax=Candidatus Finniella inopinata TaxID=1696036 RepID=UPI0013EE7275|nr:hypothetical protein [Candidatus Finniella inopinata]
MTQSFKNYGMKTYYNAQSVMKKAANRNKIPKILLLKRFLRISLLAGPLLALLLWMLLG